MKARDKVMINPFIEDGAWDRTHKFRFLSSSMKGEGVYSIGRILDDGTIYINGFYYDPDWLLPVHLFKVGDKVKIREGLHEGDDVPFSVAYDMEDFAGKIVTINEADKDDYGGDNTNYFDGYRYHLIEDGLEFSWSSPMFDLSYNFKFKSNESRLQEQESPLRGGSREIKCGLCCRKHKPRVEVKSVGYQKVIGRG